MYLGNLEKKQKECFWVIAKELSKVDGTVSVEEEYYLNQYLKEMEFKLDCVKDLEYTVDDAIGFLAKSTSEVRIKIYIELIALALCNKEYDVNEKLMMNKIQEKFLITDKKKEEIITLVLEIFNLYNKLNVVIDD